MELRCHSCDGTYDCSWKSVGFSISTMKADQTLFQRLNAPTKAPHWPVGSSGNRPPSKIPIPLPPFRSTKSVESLSRPLQLSEQGHILETAIEAGVNAVIGMRDSLNDWDSKVGDGDCGPTGFPKHPHEWRRRSELSTTTHMMQLHGDNEDLTRTTMATTRQWTE
ncbi:hypothetical protein V6N11_067964 [Hibiscus sabdariffa]|uniref:DhaK domain-containing protein n=1 Tax=Hibiscus sabdariffa TaxID=183260 RepID=A0ABR2SSA9_9ROSI